MRTPAPDTPSGASPLRLGRLKICLLTRAPFVGGAEIGAERLGVGLQAAGHDVLVVVGTDGPVMDRMVRAGLRCVESPICCTDVWHWWRYDKARRALRRLFRRERPDIIHSNDLPTHQIVSDASRGLQTPRVCHHRFPFGGTCIDWLNKYGAEVHVFVSEVLRRQMCAASARLASSNHAVVHDGLSLPPWPTEPARHAARVRVNLPLDKTIVLFAGQIIERKGVADLLHAWALVDPAVRHGAELVLVGDDLQGNGAYRAAMQGLAARLGCPARFEGFRLAVSDWYLGSDLLVMPSTEEPLGFAAMEAMAYALPVIGSAVGGIPEMVVHEETGLLVPPRSPDRLAEAFERLLADRSARLRYGRQGRRRCEQRFSLDRHVWAVLKQYEHVLGVARRAAA